MLLAIILIVFGIIIDQVVKHVIGNYFDYNESTNGVKVIGEFFKITYRENTGVVWGLGSNQAWLKPILVIIAFIALAFFTYLFKFYDLKNHTIFSISLILLIIGTIGNLIDRLFLGYVIDYLEFDIFNFAIFNFADSCLTIGTILLLFDILFGKSGEFLK